MFYFFVVKLRVSVIKFGKLNSVQGVMYSIYINPVIVKLFGNKTPFDISAEQISHIALSMLTLLHLRTKI